MAFGKRLSVVPASIGNIVITLRNKPDATNEFTFEVVTLDASGNLVTVESGDLKPHLTAAQQTQVTAFLAAMRNKAQTEILP